MDCLQTGKPKTERWISRTLIISTIYTDKLKCQKRDYKILWQFVAASIGSVWELCTGLHHTHTVQIKKIAQQTIASIKSFA